ncbi:MAG: insulinase family protein [Alphaproteobacteria bacterium]|nr:insulinase family protein [Rickettsiales bacterium]
MIFSKDPSKNIKKTILPNQLNVITDKVTFVDSVIVAVMVGAGSQNENSNNNGVAHFLEHMAFKGTTTRSAKDISDAIEDVGGYVNAYTSKERTMYYIKVLKQDVELAVSILADILQNSVIDKEELDKERGVILQEMKASFDTPSDIVFDYFAEHAFGKNTTLGRSIIGTEQTIKNMNRDKINDFIKKHYYAQNMVVGACGNIEHDKFTDLVGNYFADIAQNNSTHDVKCNYIGNGGVMYAKKDLQQMQFILSFGGYSELNLDKSIRAVFLASILGGGMSSRLFQEIREKRGLAYSVSMNASSYKDTGLFFCYADSSVDKLNDIFDAVVMVLRSAMKQIDNSEVDRTLNKFKSSVLMSKESLHSRVEKMMDNFLTFGRYIESDEVISIAKSITPNEMSMFLRDTVSNKDSKQTLLVYGDFDSKPPVVKDFSNFVF